MQYLNEGLPLARSAGITTLLAHTLMAWGLAWHDCGDDCRALPALQESLALVRGISLHSWGIADYLWSIAGVALHHGLSKRAAHLYGASIALRERLGIPIQPTDQPLADEFEARARAALGEAAYRTALATGAAMPLDAAIDDALALVLPEDGAPSPGSVGSGVARSLSRREWEVVRLLADGRSNQEIAATLFISPRTVANHVTSVMNKLGLESRTAVAAWAIRQGLA
jgi:DNA-binding CsgD family transcriptional regulator